MMSCREPRTMAGRPSSSLTPPWAIMCRQRDRMAVPSTNSELLYRNYSSIICKSVLRMPMASEHDASQRIHHRLQSHCQHNKRHQNVSLCNEQKCKRQESISTSSNHPSNNLCCPFVARQCFSYRMTVIKQCRPAAVSTIRVMDDTFGRSNADKIRRGVAFHCSSFSVDGSKSSTDRTNATDHASVTEFAAVAARLSAGQEPPPPATPAPPWW